MPMQHQQILVIEDDVAIRDALSEVLQDEGYGVIGTANGQEAIDVLQHTQRFCVILLDLMMPVMNGWQFRTLQRQDPRFAPIPVVVISADAAAQQHVTMLDVAGFVTKPVQLDALLSLIGQVCHHGAPGVR